MRHLKTDSSQARNDPFATFARLFKPKHKMSRGLALGFRDMAAVDLASPLIYLCERQRVGFHVEYRQGVPVTDEARDVLRVVVFRMQPVFRAVVALRVVQAVAPRAGSDIDNAVRPGCRFTIERAIHGEPTGNQTVSAIDLLRARIARRREPQRASALVGV